MSRGPNLEPAAVDRIVAAVARMEAPVSWVGVVAAARAATGHAYTRQTLWKQPQVAEAYRKLREEAPEQSCAHPGRRTSPTRREATRRLEREIAELRAQVWSYRERFILMTQNAFMMNIDEGELLKPLEPSAIQGELLLEESRRPRIRD